MTETGGMAFVGDSLTADGRWSEWFTDEGVQNFGVGGDTTDDLLEHLDDVINCAPSTVVLLIGTNDLAWRRSVEHIVRNIETALVRLRKALPDSYLLVQSVLPREREYAEVIKDVNRHLWQFAPTVRAQYLDLWPAMGDADGGIGPEYSEDHLHLTERGYEAWVAELRTGLAILRSHAPMSTSIPIPPEYLTRRGRH